MDDTPETEKLLQQGKLEQTCPKCGITEAAHHYCTACFTPMGPADWYPTPDRRTPAQRAAMEAASRARWSRQNAPRADLPRPEAPQPPGVGTGATLKK